VIGTNKPDALETVTCMMEDLANGIYLNPAQPEVEAAKKLVQERQPNYFSYDDWLKLDEIEVAKGQALGRPRLKFTSIEAMRAALGR
jgi:ferredoxin--NADP+ reductase